MPLLSPASAGHEPEGAGEDFVSVFVAFDGEESPPEEPLDVDVELCAAGRESVR